MTQRFSTKKLLRFGGLTLLALVIFGYSISRAGDLLFGIHLNVSGIQDGQSVTVPAVALSGDAHHAIGVTIDGNPVSIDTDGQWHETVILQPGYNSVKVSAADKFGRDTSDQFAVYYDAPVETLPAASTVAPTDTTATGTTDTVPSSPSTGTGIAKPVAVFMAKTKVTAE